MFNPENTPPRDEFGFFHHPDIPNAEEGVNICNILLMLGYQPSIWHQDEDSTYDSGKYGEGEWIGAKNWNPEPPLPHCQCIAIYDTEDGPAALFIQPINGSRQDRLLQDAMLNHMRKEQTRKMEHARAKGRCGWWWPTCKPATLEELMQTAIGEKDWASVANYAGMLAFREYHAYPQPSDLCIHEGNKQGIQE